MTRQQSLWLFIWIFIFFLFFCLWNKLPYIVSTTPQHIPTEKVVQAPNTINKDIHFKVFKDEQAITLSGVLPDAESKAKIVDAYGKYFSKLNVENLLIDSEVDNSNIIDFFTNFADIFSQFDSGYLAYDHHSLEIDGVAKHNIVEKRVNEALQTLQGIIIDNKLTIKPEAEKVDLNLSDKVQMSHPKTATEIQEEINHLLKNRRVQFLYARDILTKESQSLVDKIIKILQENEHLILYIEGHTDSDGTKKNNLRLSQRRAESVKQYIAKQGIDKNRLHAIGYGESRPLVPNNSLKNRQKNRRVEFIVKGE